jgi:hypothetical protein
LRNSAWFRPPSPPELQVQEEKKAKVLVLLPFFTFSLPCSEEVQEWLVAALNAEQKRSVVSVHPLRQTTRQRLKESVPSVFLVFTLIVLPES